VLLPCATGRGPRQRSHPPSRRADRQESIVAHHSARGRTVKRWQGRGKGVGPFRSTGDCRGRRTAGSRFGLAWIPTIRLALPRHHDAGLSGFEVAARCRSLRPDIPVLLPAAMPPNRWGPRPKWSPTTRILRKPYDPDALRACRAKLVTGLGKPVSTSYEVQYRFHSFKQERIGLLASRSPWVISGLLVRYGPVRRIFTTANSYSNIGLECPRRRNRIAPAACPVETHPQAGWLAVWGPPATLRRGQEGLKPGDCRILPGLGGAHRTASLGSAPVVVLQAQSVHQKLVGDERSLFVPVVVCRIVDLLRLLRRAQALRISISGTPFSFSAMVQN